MFELVYGGSGSGKSEYAESLFADVQSGKYYIATMEPFSEAAKIRISRHQKMREGKGFRTIERQSSLLGLEFKEKAEAVLIECVSNLLANEMFSENLSAKEAAEKTVSDILYIKENTSDLAVVTNDVARDGKEYDEETESYILALEEVNRRLAQIADKVTEVVCGIPVTIK
ncbi:MAG: bifunctional adenosylcobinamide kinase/adenosylcobinamide-phosphate guanylyltransferase [Eubacterium sp.]|nr:bifunctional adenosylcobinamide kinase/adenosylcobinamide-phosphate guanylyltransferase [Eubacterium sp.]